MPTAANTALAPPAAAEPDLHGGPPCPTCGGTRWRRLPREHAFLPGVERPVAAECDRCGRAARAP